MRLKNGCQHNQQADLGAPEQLRLGRTPPASADRSPATESIARWMPVRATRSNIQHCAAVGNFLTREPWHVLGGMAAAPGSSRREGCHPQPAEPFSPVSRQYGPEARLGNHGTRNQSAKGNTVKKAKNLLVTGAVLGGMIAIPVTLSPPASAATPGSSCYIVLSTLLDNTRVPGTVSADGTTCTPDTPLAPPFAALNAGLPCGFTQANAYTQITVKCPG